MDKHNFKVNTGHFASTSEEEKAKILEDRTAKNTNRSTKTIVKCFSDYLAAKELPVLPELLDANLPQVLKDFYTNMRTKKAELYNTQSMKSMRSNLARYFTNTRKIDIVNDPRFIDA